MDTLSSLLSFLSKAGRAAVMGSQWGGSMAGGDQSPGGGRATAEGAERVDLPEGVQLTLYSMMALVNLSYCRLPVQATSPPLPIPPRPSHPPQELSHPIPFPFPPHPISRRRG